MNIKKDIEAMEDIFQEQQAAVLAATAKMSGDVGDGPTTPAQVLALRSSNHQSIEIEQLATHLSGIDALMHLLQTDEEAGDAFDRMVNDKVDVVLKDRITAAKDSLRVKMEEVHKESIRKIREAADSQRKNIEERHKVHIQNMKGNRGIRRSKEQPGVESPIPDCFMSNRKICLLPRCQDA